MDHIYYASENSQKMKAASSLEKDLLQAALDFDQSTLGQIYDLYSGEIYCYAMRFLGDQCVAEDCVADTFSRFLKILYERRGPENYLRAYLYRIAHNWIADYYRRSHDTLELKDMQPNSEPLTEQEFDLRVRQTHIRNALLRLTPDQQRVIGLKYFENWSNEEVAQAMHKPVGAIKSLQHRALESLKRILEKEKFEWINTPIP